MFEDLPHPDHLPKEKGNVLRVFELSSAGIGRMPLMRLRSQPLC